MLKEYVVNTAFHFTARLPPPTRQEEQALGLRILAGEHALLEALLATRAGTRVVADVRAELIAETTPIEHVVRNVDTRVDDDEDNTVDPTVAQRTQLLAALASRGARRARRLAEIRLHPAVIDRLEAAVEASPETAVDPSLLARVHAAHAEIRAAKDELFERNVPLVISIASRFNSRHLSRGDLIQEGNLGLMHAIEKFDPRRGYRLSTYASWWIKQAVDRAISDQAPTIRLPVHLVESRARVRRARAAMEGTGQEPTTEELARRSGLAPEKVEMILGLAGEPVSLETPLGASDDAGTIADLVANDTSPLPEDDVERARLGARARGLLQGLTERERQILAMRFGLDGAPERTLEEIGTMMSLTRERIRQIEIAALRKLRARCDAQSFRPEL